MAGSSQAEQHCPVRRCITGGLLSFLRVLCKPVSQLISQFVSQFVSQFACVRQSTSFDLASSLCADSGVCRPHLHSACTCFTLTERSSGFRESAEPCAGSRLLNTVPCVHCNIHRKRKSAQQHSQRESCQEVVQRVASILAAGRVCLKAAAGLEWPWDWLLAVGQSQLLSAARDYSHTGSCSCCIPSCLLLAPAASWGRNPSRSTTHSRRHCKHRDTQPAVDQTRTLSLFQTVVRIPWRVWICFGVLAPRFGCSGMY